jgi:site-specific recombinase XerD
MLATQDAHPSPTLGQEVEQAINTYLTYLSVVRDLSPHSLRAYKHDLNAYAQWVQQQLAHSPQQWPTVQAYMASLAASSLSAASLARATSALRKLGQFAQREGLLPTAQLRFRLHAPKASQRLPHFLQPHQVAQLADALAAAVTVAQAESPQAAALAVRNQVAFALLATSGLRVAELVALNWGDCDMNSGQLTLMGKGSKQRLAFMATSTHKLLELWQVHWPHLAVQAPLVRPKGKAKATTPPPVEPQGQQPLLLNAKGGRLTTRSVHRLLAELGTFVGLAQPLHPHVLRHTYATQLLNHGVELRYVQELMGHASLRSTQIYTHVSVDRLRSAYLKAHPMATEGR